MEGFNIVKRRATPQEYTELRKSVGWWCLGMEAVAAGLSNTLFSICAEKDGEVIGHGRLIGDGGLAFYIQDVIVKPAYQRSGIGKRIMAEIMEHVRLNYPEGTMVCLMAAKGKEDFYRKFGFIERPNDVFGPGMIQYIKR